MSRSELYTIAGLTLAAALATGCSEHRTAPVAMRATTTATSRTMSDLAVAPSSPGWQQEARTLAASRNMSPLAATRVYAALGVAQYRAVLAVEDADTDGVVPENGVGAGGRSALEARRGAVAGASATVLSFFFPTAAAALEQRVATEGAASPGDVHPNFTRGVDVGRTAGQAIVTRTQNDRFTTPWTGTVPTGDGMWIANGVPAGATFGGVTPYFMTSGSQFRPAAPPAWNSTAFLADLTEVLAFTSNRTPEQQANAVYWNFATGTYTPPGYWNHVASEYVQAHGLDERAATRTFALTNAAMMDALIGCWEAKYHYWTIRPSQAQSQITLSFGLPNHPSYPSGHSCVSAAAATVLTHLFPDRGTEVGAWVTEAGLSRMYAGIHYRFDIDAGAALGVNVGQWAIAHEQLIR